MLQQEIRTPVQPPTRYHKGLTALQSRLLGRIDAATFRREPFNPRTLARPGVLTCAEIERAVRRLAALGRIQIDRRDGWRRFWSSRTDRWTGWAPVHKRRRRPKAEAGSQERRRRPKAEAGSQERRRRPKAGAGSQEMRRRAREDRP